MHPRASKLTRGKSERDEYIAASWYEDRQQGLSREFTDAIESLVEKAADGRLPFLAAPARLARYLARSSMKTSAPAALRTAYPRTS